MLKRNKKQTNNKKQKLSKGFEVNFICSKEGKQLDKLIMLTELFERRYATSYKFHPLNGFLLIALNLMTLNTNTMA